jgi:HK97 family phage portal protein
MRSLIGKIVDKAPVPYTGRRSSGFGMPLGLAGNATGQLRAMGSVGTLFAIVHRTSNATSQVKWRLYRTAKSGLDEDRIEVTSHLALDVWKKPNDFYTRQELVETTQQHVDLVGEGWWVVARDPRTRSIPLELWPVRPDRIEPIPHPTDFLTGYVYTSPDGERVPLALDEVIQLRMPNPEDPYRGMGPVQSILTEIDATRHSAQWNLNFFRNSAEPGGIIEVDKRLSDDEFDEMSARWREQHQGVANAHRVAILEQGKWVDRKFTQRDMQFAELRGVSSAVIREAFGMPKFAVGDVDDVNRATAEASKAWFAEMLTVPRLERIKGALNNDFLPLFGPTAEGLEFDYDNPVPPNPEQDNADRDSRASTAKILIDAGFSPSDTLTTLGLPEIPYGLPGTDPDRDLLIKLVTGAPTLAPLILPMLGFELPDDAESEPAPADTAQDTWHRHDLVARVHRARPYNAVELRAGVDLEGVQTDWERQLKALSADWDSLTRSQLDALAAQVRAAINHQDPAALAALTIPTADGKDLVAAAMATLAAAAAARVVDEAAAQSVTIDPAPVTEAGFAPAAGVVASLITAGWVLAGAREALRWSGYGHDGDAVAKAVTAHLRGLSTVSLSAQLGGALTWAQNTGRLATLDLAPRATYWASEKLDNNTCTRCKAIDGKELPTLDAAQLAYGGGGYLMCEGTVRCRGTMIALWE